jgi:hypothetical protein
VINGIAILLGPNFERWESAISGDVTYDVYPGVHPGCAGNQQKQEYSSAIFKGVAIVAGTRRQK